MPCLPITFFDNFNLGMSRVGRRNRFKSIVSTAEGVLWNMRRSHRLACGTRSKTSCVIFFRCAGGGMSCKRSSAYLRQLKHACANPCSACFDGFAGPVVFRVRFLKKRKHSFDTVRSPSCHQSLIVFVVFFHN